MTPSALAKELFNNYEHFRVDEITPSNCKHEAVIPEFRRITGLSKGRLHMEEIGTSLEGRSIHLLSCGKGEKTVLLWSQMHGDEPTATLALLDLFKHMATESLSPEISGLLDETRIYAVPMLNPDGAERIQRRTACNIDMNRDALALVTPEANILRSLQRKLKPRFGFNLHDQELSSVGSTREVTAIALLAPALDEKKTTPLVRIRAMRVAAFIARTLAHFIPHNIARYNDTYEPRAFGDRMQSWGTSTVLIESGHWPADPGKSFVRKLNYVGILSSLCGIATGAYQDVDLDHYHDLPENGKRIFDIIIKDVVIEHPNGAQHGIDIGLTRSPSLNNHTHVTIKDIGDLSTMSSLEVIDGGLRKSSVDYLKLDATYTLEGLLDTLQLYYPRP
ncbi:MAG: M14 family zinc carboxypeptidase [Bacteroidota bacterium]